MDVQDIVGGTALIQKQGRNEWTQETIRNMCKKYIYMYVE